MLHFTIQTLVLTPAPFQPSPSPIPGGSRVQHCPESWRTNAMEKLGMQLLASAGLKVKHEFIPLESNIFPGRGDPWHSPDLQAHRSCLGDMEPAGKGAGSTDTCSQSRSRSGAACSALLCPLRLCLFPYHRPAPPCSPHPAPSLSQTGCFLPGIHLPAAPGRAGGCTRCSGGRGSFRGGSRGRGAGTAAPLCIPCLPLAVPQP